MSEANAMTEHVVHALSDFGMPPTARALCGRIAQIGRYDARQAQRAVQMALDRGVVILGKGLRLETPPNPLTPHEAGWNRSRMMNEAGNERTRLAVEMREAAAKVARADNAVNRSAAEKRICHRIAAAIRALPIEPSVRSPEHA